MVDSSSSSQFGRDGEGQTPFSCATGTACLFFLHEEPYERENPLPVEAHTYDIRRLFRART